MEDHTLCEMSASTSYQFRRKSVHELYLFFNLISKVIIILSRTQTNKLVPHTVVSWMSCIGTGIVGGRFVADNVLNFWNGFDWFWWTNLYRCIFGFLLKWSGWQSVMMWLWTILLHTLAAKFVPVVQCNLL